MSSDLSPETRALLDAARSARRPSAGDRARVKAALHARLAPHTQPPPPLPPPPPAAPPLHLASGGRLLSPFVRVGLAALVLSAAGVGGFLALRHRGPAAATATAPTSAPSAVAPPVAPSGNGGGSGSSSGTIAAAAPSPASATDNAAPGAEPASAGSNARAGTNGEAPSDPSAEPLVAAAAPSHARSSSRHHDRRGAHGPPGAAQASASTVANAAGQPTTGATTGASSNVAPTNGASSSPSRTPDLFDAEIRLVRGAQAALNRHDPATALRLLDQHAAQFPAGQFREESRANRVLALCALGRLDAARAEAARFLRDAPRSMYAARVRTSCALRDPAGR